MSAQRLRWGILGTGRIAASMIGAVRAGSTGTVHAVSSRDHQRAKAFAGVHTIPIVHESYQQLLDDPSVDVVYVPLPISEHATWALRAIAAGKPVLVEKPFAMSAAQAEQVFAAGHQRNVAVGEAMMYRFHPLTRRVQELVRGGAVGDVRVVRSTFIVDISDRNDIRWKPETGGGAMRDLGCYCIDVSRLLIGQEPDQAVGSSVTALGVDATVAASLRFPSGAVASMNISIDGAFDCSYEVLGTTGRLRVDSGGMVAWPGTEFAITTWTARGRSEEMTPAANHYQLMADAFCEHIRGGRPYAVPARETIANHAVMDLLLTQHATLKPRPAIAALQSRVTAT